VKKLIALFVSAGLVLALVLSGCATPEAEVVRETVTKTVTETVEVEKTYQCLNPKGEFVPVELNSLAPRLDTLDGKKVLFYEAEATNMQMPTLLERLEADYPNTEFLVVYTELWGEREPTEEYLTCDASIRGIGW
jgi:hypothetical protein